MITNDTICAISTPRGVGGIAVIRVSGPDAISIVDTIWDARKPLDQARSHTAHLGNIVDPADRTEGTPPLDQALVTVFRAPSSFTGENVVEISVHGSVYIQQQLLNLLIRQGCRLAEPGEFTRRAFVAGQMDLAQAEAVADLIAASSRAAHRIAARQMRGQFSSRLASLREQLLETAALLELELDFSEEDVEFASREHIRDLVDSIIHEINRLRNSFAAGNAIKEGIPVAIIGATNAGKSSLLNAIVGDDRAIVSDIHGTTRDTIEETITMADYNFRFIDTAGLRDTTDIIEQQGIERSRRAIAGACVVFAVVDVTVTTPASIAELLKTATGSTETPSIILLLNKIDLIDSDTLAAIKEQIPDTPDLTVHCISTKTGAGLDTPVNGLTLADILRQIADRRFATGTDDILVTNARHLQALTNAAESAARVADSLAVNLSGDLIAQDLRQTIAHLAAITGDIPSDTVLATIFSRFCIGK